jgi:hypothetical protein
VFRRRRSADAGQDWPQDADQGLADEELEGEPEDEDYDEPAGDAPGAGVPRPEGGPWDVMEPFSQRERVDLGSLQVPVGPEHEIQLVMAEQHGAWVTVRHGDSELQLQAFASSRSGELWDDVRADIRREVTEAGGQAGETEGQFGTELIAHVPAELGQPASGLQLVRFVGVDGPRWFLRGLFTGSAAGGGEPASLLEEVFSDVVVIRGDHPVPPRDILELRLPPEAQKALEDQAAAEQAAGEQAAGEQAPAGGDDRSWTGLEPFDRGPEFTETR